MIRKRLMSTFALTAVAAAFVATHVDELAQSPVALADAVTDASASLTKYLPLTEDRAGRHLGFDTYAYPGDEVMRDWRSSAPYEWVGYYLSAPCHDGETWMGKRARLTDMGWGMAVIYVGQQTWDKTPRGYETYYKTVRRTKYINKRVRVSRVVNGTRVHRYVTRRVAVKRSVRVPVKVHIDPIKRPIDDCNAQLVNATRGKIEANDAIRRTAAEGFPTKSVIFLDVEYMKDTPAKMREYYRAWARQVLADGRYRPGLYVHTRNAALVYKDVKQEYLRAGLFDEPPLWIASKSGSFTTDNYPQDVGHPFAAMWQGMLDIVEEWSGHALAIDVNVAQVPDPSHQYVAEGLQ
ncbi:MAG TPA: glycoside hydrolase domain-containing protein [Gemmatimonadaceae bacterium]|nr:glycoside hydrolase domain-containing protein [Gemmatimonadaceae bacterium]